MTVSISSPITGAAQTGLTSPTYTLTSDVAPDNNGKQYAVTALGGTQTGVETTSASKPFTLTYVRPKNYRILPPLNTVTGVPPSVPRNTHKLIGRKGVEITSGIFATANFTLSMDIPAGSEIQDPESVRALLSAFAGALYASASGIGDTLVTGVM
jgi:hypothetical protein